MRSLRGNSKIRKILLQKFADCSKHIFTEEKIRKHFPFPPSESLEEDSDAYPILFYQHIHRIHTGTKHIIPRA